MKRRTGLITAAYHVLGRHCWFQAHRRRSARRVRRAVETQRLPEPRETPLLLKKLAAEGKTFARRCRGVERLDGRWPAVLGHPEKLFRFFPCGEAAGCARARSGVCITPSSTSSSYSGRPSPFVFVLHELLRCSGEATLDYPGEQFYPEGRIVERHPMSRSGIAASTFLSTAAAGIRPCARRWNFRDRLIRYTELAAMVETRRRGLPARRSMARARRSALFLGNTPDHPVNFFGALKARRPRCASVAARRRDRADAQGLRFRARGCWLPSNLSGAAADRAEVPGQGPDRLSWSSARTTIGARSARRRPRCLNDPRIVTFKAVRRGAPPFPRNGREVDGG